MIINTKESVSKKSGIYKITNNIDDRIYIGSAVNFRNRIYQHIKALKDNKHHSKHLQNFVNKYGMDNIKFEFVEFVDDKTKLIEKEQYYLDLLKPSFNILLTAGNQSGYVFSDESKLKMSITRKEYLKQHPEVIEETKRRNSLLYKGRITSDEVKKKISNANPFKIKDNVLIEILKLIEEGEVIPEIAVKFNIDKSTIYRILRKSNRAIKGFHTRPILQYDINDNFIKEFKTTKELLDFKLSKRQVYQCCRGQRESYKNYKFKFKIKY